MADAVELGDSLVSPLKEQLLLFSFLVVFVGMIRRTLTTRPSASNISFSISPSNISFIAVLPQCCKAFG